MWKPQRLTTLWASMAYYRDSFTLPYNKSGYKISLQWCSVTVGAFFVNTISLCIFLHCKLHNTLHFGDWLSPRSGKTQKVVREDTYWVRPIRLYHSASLDT
jgi:hypothetical protein